jgi:RNA-binding motif X-linked protein 2
MWCKSTPSGRETKLISLRPPSASWHTDYRDTAYVFIGGLPFDVTEGDIVTIFSQYGEPTWIKLQRDKETGKSKGFAFLKYEDQKSTDLAVDNLGGTTVLGRTLRVDHTRYKRKDGEEEEDAKGNIEFERPKEATPPKDDEERRRRKHKDKPRLMSKEEKELQEIIENHDDEDPMKEYLIAEKRKEITESEEQHRRAKHEHRHRRRHRDRDRSRSGDRDRDSRRDRNRDGERHRERDRESRNRDDSHRRRD